MCNTNKIAPSIMCAPMFELAKYVADMEKYDIDLVHIDIMDGSFVQNYTLGTNFVKELKSKTKIPLDIHLMIEDPECKLQWFEFGEGDYVSVHFEATRHLQKALAAIRARGANAKLMHDAGANIFVCGTSSIYSTEASVEENISKFRRIIG